MLSAAMAHLLWYIIIVITFISATVVHAESLWTTYTAGTFLEKLAVQGDSLWCVTNKGCFLWNVDDVINNKISRKYL